MGSCMNFGFGTVGNPSESSMLRPQTNVHPAHWRRQDRQRPVLQGACAAGRCPQRRTSGKTAKGGPDQEGGRHPFNELTKDLPPERRRRIDGMNRELLAEMPLHELRRVRSLTQRDMAKMLKVNQPAVSKLEQRADMYVSSLRSYVEAVGGQLKIVAEFPEGEIAITDFSNVEETKSH